MFAGCGLYSIAYLHMFSGGEVRATNEPTRDRSGVCKTTTQRSNGCVAFDLTLIILRCLAFNLIIDKLPDCMVLVFSDNSVSLARFLFWTISFFHLAWGLLTMHW